MSWSRAYSGHLFSVSSALLLFVNACGDSSQGSPSTCLSNCTGGDAGTQTQAQLPGQDSAVVGTTPADGGTSSTVSGNLPCAIKKIVSDKCQMCHSDPPDFAAPMPLTTLAQFHTPTKADASKTYAQSAKTRVNAGASGAGHMPPPTSPQLTSQELSSLNAWLDQGAPASTEVCSTASSNDGGIALATSDAGYGDAGAMGTSDLDCYKLLANNGDLKTPYKVGVATDAYFNFVFASPWQGTAYGIVIRPVIDNSKVIHHWLLFQDNKPGTPSGAVSGSGAHPSGQLLHGWAPGAESIDFRETGVDVGVELPQTTYTVEIHYNSSDANATDASGVEICTAKKKPANIAALSWLGYDNSLLAGAFDGDSTTWTGTCKPMSSEPIHILSVWPHMHLQGRHMKGTINRANGTKEILHDKDFDFNYQSLYKKNVTLMPGESIVTECTYSKPMSFGEATTDEMCYLFTMAYPKGALADDGSWGKTAHGGSACLGQ
jgi:hypothetical protein